MDEADKAQDHMEREQAGVLSHRQPVGPRPNGHCYFCNGVVQSGLFCDASCRDDYDEEQRLLAIRGKK